MKHKLSKRMLALVVSTLFVSASMMAGDGTKANPFTVSELNAQKEALLSSGAAVWVKADLKGLGEDGTSTDNADTEVDGKTIHHMAALFGDADATFVAYSEAILQAIALDDLTNTSNLLISLTYSEKGHPSGNSSYPEYASYNEPQTPHFSLETVEGALSVTIQNGYRGYHVPSSYIVPSDIVAVKVSAGYSSKNGAYLKCDNAFDGATGTYTTPKNCALVLLAVDGTYPLTLTTNLYEQTMSNGNTMNAGMKAGLYTREGNFTQYYYRFVNENGKLGFERNSDNMNEVTLNSKDEVYLYVNGKETNFFGNWTWETDDKKWISWNGKSIGDYHDLTAVRAVRPVIAATETVYNLQGLRINKLQKGLNIVKGRKVLVK